MNVGLGKGDAKPLASASAWLSMVSALRPQCRYALGDAAKVTTTQEMTVLEQ
jgi:hypothetical protein